MTVNRGEAQAGAALYNFGNQCSGSYMLVMATVMAICMQMQPMLVLIVFGLVQVAIKGVQMAVIYSDAAGP